jgi:WS/DGAT/MGAT family acyltransferase
MHHALVDGAGGSSFMAALHDLVPNPENLQESSAEPRLVDTAPSVGELLTKATINSVKNSVQLATGTVRSARQLTKYALDVARKQVPAPDVSAPKTILNKPVGPHRVFDAAEFPLEGFKDIKNAAGVTINDVALAVIGGALQRYLKAKGEAPAAGSLAAAMPLNMRTRRGATEENNQVGSVFASLHTDIEDPVERVIAIRQSTENAKVSGEASPLVDALMLAGIFSPLISKSVARFWSRNALSQHIPMNISTCISNVPGPDFPLYCAGARLVDYYGLGVLTPGMGIFHLVFSYFGKITLSVLADRSIMPDPEFYHDCLVASYEELYAAAIKLGPGTPKNAAVAAKAKIQSPRRVRAVDRAPGAVVPKLHSASVRKLKGKAKSGGSRAPAVKKKPAKKRVSGAIKPASNQAPNNIVRLKAKRRNTGGPKPKLK